MRSISTYTHGILDYVVGILLIFAPNIFGFTHYGVPMTVARVIGFIFIVQALFTQYELGLFRLLPMRIHLFNDYILSALLAASPWIFNFYMLQDHVWLPHLVIGCIYFVIVSMTRRTPRLIRVERKV